MTETTFRVKLQHGADSSCAIKLADKGPGMLYFQAPIHELSRNVHGTASSVLDTATHDIEVTITCKPKFQPGYYRRNTSEPNRNLVEYFLTPPWKDPRYSPGIQAGRPSGWQRIEVVPYGLSGRPRVAPGICADCDMPETNCACG